MKTSSNRSKSNTNTNIKQKRKPRSRRRRRVYGGDEHAAENSNYRNLCRRTLDLVADHIHAAHVAAHAATEAAAQAAEIANNALAAQAAAEEIDEMNWEDVTDEDAAAAEPEAIRLAATRARALATDVRVAATTASGAVATVRIIANDLYAQSIPIIERAAMFAEASNIASNNAQTNPEDRNLQLIALEYHREATASHDVAFYARYVNSYLLDRINILINIELATQEHAAQTDRDATALENAATVAEQTAAEHAANRHIWRNSKGGKKSRTRTGRGSGSGSGSGTKKRTTRKKRIIRSKHKY